MSRSNPLHEPPWDSAVFFPRSDVFFGLLPSNGRDHMFDVEGASLRLRIFEGLASAPIILLFHGNGELATDYDFVAERYLALPATLMVAEYRGYGPSSGVPSLRTFLGDAHRTLDEVQNVARAQGLEGPVVAMGRSLGSAPAIELASRRKADVAALIVESGFAHMLALLELLGVPAETLQISEQHGPMNLAKMAQIDLPTLILHAENDAIIPIRDAEELLAASADKGKRLLRVRNAGHNDIQLLAGAAYFDELGTLLGRAKALFVGR